MARTKRRAYPHDGTAVIGNKYGKRGNARDKDTSHSTGGGPEAKYTVAERRRKKGLK